MLIVFLHNTPAYLLPRAFRFSINFFIIIFQSFCLTNSDSGSTKYLCRASIDKNNEPILLYTKNSYLLNIYAVYLTNLVTNPRSNCNIEIIEKPQFHNFATFGNMPNDWKPICKPLQGVRFYSQRNLGHSKSQLD